jgi:hypothetical protein
MWLKPAISEILDAFHQAYRERHNAKLHEQCRAHALQYDADKVFAENWVPALEKLGKPREVPPLPSMNREQRCAKIKAKGKVAA